LLQCEGGPTEVVEECLAKALDTARPQGARLFELRSATALARVMAEHNEHKAVDILAPIYNWFTEGLGTSDLNAPRSADVMQFTLFFVLRSSLTEPHLRIGGNVEDP
jgi:hypothetical protein